MTKWGLFLEYKNGSAYENHIKSMKWKKPHITTTDVERIS